MLTVRARRLSVTVGRNSWEKFLNFSLGEILDHENSVPFFSATRALQKKPLHDVVILMYTYKGDKGRFLRRCCC